MNSGLDVKHVELMLSYDAREKFGFKSSKSFSKYIMEKLKRDQRIGILCIA